MKNSIFLFLFVLCSLLCGICYAQWQPDVRLTNEPAGSFTSENNAWCIAANGNILHVVWYDIRDGNYEIYYKRSTDGGTNWGTDTRLTNNPGISNYPSVAVSGSVVHVVWSDSRDTGIYYKRSIDGGISWGADERLTNITAAFATSFRTSVSVSGTFVHVVWHDLRDGNIEVYYKRSTDGGASWGGDTRLTNHTGQSVNPSVTVSGSIVHVVWEEQRDGNPEIYYKRSSDGGLSWGPDTRLTNSAGNSRFASVSVSGSVVHVVWREQRDGNMEIYYKNSSDGGTSWGADTRLTNNTANSQFPSVAVSGSVVHIVWWDFRNTNDEIYYKRSTDEGASWEADTRLTSNSAESQYPSVAVSGSAVHVLWNDDRNGNWEIYYKRDPSGNPALTFQSQYNRNNLNKPITDNGNTLDTILVGLNSPITYFVLDVNLKIDTVIHTNASDLEFYLIHNGITDTVIYQVGGSGDNFIGTVLNDSAATLISNGTAPFTGLYRPHKPLEQFNNSDVNGAWVLKIFDRATGNTGTLQAWSLIFTINNNPIGLVPISNVVPEGYTLSQNYPNPFNPVTNIEFAVLKSTFVKLAVFDITGRELETLVNQNLTAGTYKADWDASKYSSGIYFYTIETESFRETKKMMLVK